MSLPEELHKILHTDLSWHDKALCKGVTHIFFSERGSNNVHYAKELCSKCEVSSECLNYAITNNIKYGIWAGYSYRQRLKIKRSMK